MRLFSLFLSMSLFGGALMPGPLDGVYHSEDLTMHICDSLATFTFSEGHGVTYSVAVCSLTKETDSFIRLDSPSPNDRVMACIQFEESFSADCDPDSIYVTFDFPVHNEEYLITVCDNDTMSFNTYKEIKYPEQRTIVIPRSIPSQNHFSWGISTEGSFSYEDMLHIYLPKWLWPVFPLRYRNYNTNVLHVTVSCIDDQFFGQTWIQGEYMKVCDEGLLWRGQLFKREEKKEDDRLPQPLVTIPETQNHL